MRGREGRELQKQIVGNDGDSLDNDSNLRETTTKDPVLRLRVTEETTREALVMLLRPQETRGKCKGRKRGEPGLYCAEESGSYHKFI
jgi:hypothetical protein